MPTHTCAPTSLPRPSGSRTIRRFVPTCERLEDRCVPANLSVQPAHVYDFNGSLADSQGGPAMIADGGTLQGGRYVFGPDQGLRLQGALADTSTFSIVARVTIDAANPTFKKLIDFNGGAADDGLYVAGANLRLYPFGSGSDAVPIGTDFLVTLTRDGSTGETKVYLNNMLEATYEGTTVDVSQNNLLTFFEDDGHPPGGEAVGGSVDFIGTFNGVLTAQDVAILSSSSLGVTVSQTQLTVSEGQTATNTGSWAGDGIHPVTLSASSGKVVENSDGTWSWSLPTTDGPDDSRAVTITATDSVGATASVSFALTVNNVAPSVAPDGGTVTVPEGTTATMTGTWSDPGNDVVTLSASSGTVVKNSNGTWSWSLPTTDGPDDSRTVTVTATDSDGAMASVSFALTVNNVAPSVGASTATVSVPAGSTATMTGTWSDPGNDVVTLAASVGSVVKNANGTWTWSDPNASASQTVTITATDGDGASSNTGFGLTVTSVVTLQLTSLTSSNPNLAQPSTDGSVKIDGAFADAAGKATVKVNWGDGLQAETLKVDQSAHAFQGDHRYASGGVFTITVTVTDAKGASVSKSTTAVVAGVGVVDGVLYVVGSQRAEEISIDLVKGGARGREDFYQVTLRVGDGWGCRTETFTVRADSVSGVVVVAGTNDSVHLGKGVTADVETVPAATEPLHGHPFGEAFRHLLQWLEALRRGK